MGMACRLTNAVLAGAADGAHQHLYSPEGTENQAAGPVLALLAAMPAPSAGDAVWSEEHRCHAPERA